MERNGTLDYARLVAAIGIIIFHVGSPGAFVGYAALPFFLMLLVYLAFPAASKQDFSFYAKARIARLLKPWVVWSLIYGALKLADAFTAGRPLHTEFAPWMLLTGPGLHLWFLPFACAACIAVWPLAQCSTWLRPLGILAFSAIGLLLAAKILHLADLTQTQPIAQWLFALPAVLVGSAFALLNRKTVSGLYTSLALVSLVLVLLLFAWPQGSLQLVLAGGALLLCLIVPIPSTPAARSSAELALLLYLAHPMVISLLLRTTALVEESTSLAIAAVISTILFSFVLRRMSLPEFTKSS